MATEAPLPTVAYDRSDLVASSSPFNTFLPYSKAYAPDNPSPGSQVLTTIYSWPALEPLRFESYPSNHLSLPLRRDILHRAVIYEGDKTRQGTASTKWRGDVHGSNRKVLPQKGTGRARAGDSKSPIRKGGGVSFGPHPRDFSTGLQRKVYDLAWRTALSYRYIKGELFIVDNPIAIEKPLGARYLINVFQGNEWGSGFGRATLVTSAFRARLFREMDLPEMLRHGVVKDMFDVDVKDLLKTGRIVIEKHALDTILKAHISDIGPKHTMKHAAKLVAMARRGESKTARPEKKFRAFLDTASDGKDHGGMEVSGEEEEREEEEVDEEEEEEDEQEDENDMDVEDVREEEKKEDSGSYRARSEDVP
jgi:large subunit ribosomal protein L4